MSAEDREYAEILALIGAISTTWSQTESTWFLIFLALMKSTPPAQAAAVYFHLETSAQHRKLICAVAAAAFPPDTRGKPSKIRERVGQLNSLAEQLAGDRNSAIHIEIGVAPTSGDDPFSYEYRALPGYNYKKVSRYADKNLTKELRQTLDGIAKLHLQLHAFLEDLKFRLTITRETADALRSNGLSVPADVDVEGE